MRHDGGADRSRAGLERYRIAAYHNSARGGPTKEAHPRALNRSDGLLSVAVTARGPKSASARPVPHPAGIPPDPTAAGRGHPEQIRIAGGAPPTAHRTAPHQSARWAQRWPRTRPRLESSRQGRQRGLQRNTAAPCPRSSAPRTAQAPARPTTAAKPPGRTCLVACLSWPVAHSTWRHDTHSGRAQSVVSEGTVAPADQRR